MRQGQHVVSDALMNPAGAGCPMAGDGRPSRCGNMLQWSSMPAQGQRLAMHSGVISDKEMEELLHIIKHGLEHSQETIKNKAFAQWRLAVS